MTLPERLTPLFSGIVASAAGAATEAFGLVQQSSGNTALYIALCGAFGAFVAVVPRVMIARANAKQAESEFLGRQTHELIRYLRKEAHDHERILALSTTVRHEIQGGYQAALWQMEFMEHEWGKAGLAPLPKFTPIDVVALLRQLDKDINLIKSEKTPDEK